MSKKVNNNWSTPQDLFSLLDMEFHFDLDACASSWNAKCKKYYSKDDDALSKDWPWGANVWMNPPYGNFAGKFLKHAYKQSQERSCTVVCLIPTNTETKWFQDYCLNGELRFVRGRVHFKNKAGKIGRPRFSLAVVIFRPNKEGKGLCSTLHGYKGGK